MPKESQNKKKYQQAQATASTEEKKPTKRYLTDEEKAWIIRERLARSPVIVWRYRNGKWNKRLILMLALMVIALVVALVFLTR